MASRHLASLPLAALVQRQRHSPGSHVGISHRQQRHIPSRQPPLEGGNELLGGGEQGIVVRLVAGLPVVEQTAEPRRGAARGAATRRYPVMRGPRPRSGAQGQNAYLSRASTLRSAPNQQLFWS